MSLNYTQAAIRLKMICNEAQIIHAAGKNPLGYSSGLCSMFSHWSDNKGRTWLEDYSYYPLMNLLIGTKHYGNYLGRECEYSAKRQAVVATIGKMSVRTLRRHIAKAASTDKQLKLFSYNPIQTFEFLNKK